MNAPILDSILAQVRAALEKNNLSQAAKLIEKLRPADQAEVFAELDEDEQIALLSELPVEESADILEELDEDEAAELVEAMSPADAIRIVDGMEPDEAADLLGDLPPEQAHEMLAQLEDSDEVRPLLLHADDSAGGLMTSEFLALRRRTTAAAAIQALRDWKPDRENIYYLFVIDAEQKLRGVVSLRDLVIADPDTPLEEIMDPDVIAVTAGVDQEEAARVMTRYDLLALPVIDENGKLLGVITIDDVVDVLEDEASEDIQRLGGSQPLDKAYLNTSVLGIAKKRIGWLLLLFVTESLTGTVLRHFESELQAVVALSFFIPLLIGTGGNAGSQTTATIIRALAVGDIDFGDAIKVWWHETRVGIVLG
ncbi:MAG TPA: magnesium transporter, partial [Anaerolineae bacterium]|nr:magnesium transporter [Anaerolineae bacterium]